MYEIPPFGLASKILPEGKYLALRTWGQTGNLQAYRASMAMLKTYTSLKPKPPYFILVAPPVPPNHT